MNKLFVLLLVGLLLVSSVSAYICIEDEDNYEVKMFKNKINMLALRQDIDNNITVDAFNLKLKYFNPCKEW